MTIGQYQGIRWLECLNESGYEIPPFSLAKITGATWEDPGRTVLRLIKPEADNDYPLVVTNHAPIADGDYGLCSCEGPVFVKYDTAATPAAGEVWGAANASFKATKDRNGLLILGAVDSVKEVVLADICRWEQYVNIITFRLAEALDVTDEYVTATISEQSGPGKPSPHTGAGAIRVYNLPKQAGDYEFYGDSGDYGRTAWMYGSYYKILIVECP